MMKPSLALPLITLLASCAGTPSPVVVDGTTGAPTELALEPPLDANSVAVHACVSKHGNTPTTETFFEHQLQVHTQVGEVLDLFAKGDAESSVLIWVDTGVANIATLHGEVLNRVDFSNGNELAITPESQKGFDLAMKTSASYCAELNEWTPIQTPNCGPLEKVDEAQLAQWKSGVVKIESKNKPEELVGSGSFVTINGETYVATAQHVVTAVLPVPLVVDSNGNRLTVTTVRLNSELANYGEIRLQEDMAERDIALLGLELPKGYTPPYQFNVSKARSLDQSVTMGWGEAGFYTSYHTNGVDRSTAPNSLRAYMPNCLIAPGNSGGPLIDPANGQMIGVNAAIMSLKDQKAHPYNYFAPADLALELQAGR
jgi:S1-C subfamily serine protease